MNTLPFPFRTEFPFGSVFRDLERALRDYDDTFTGRTASPMPAFTSEQTDDAYRVTVELPGFADGDVKVDIHRGVLTVSGERPLAVPEGFRAVHRERGMTKFSRSVRLPDEVDDERVRATMEDGVLSVTLPKRPEVKPRQIAVTSR